MSVVSRSLLVVSTKIIIAEFYRNTGFIGIATHLLINPGRIFPPRPLLQRTTDNKPLTTTAMPIINYKNLKEHLKALGDKPFAPVYLIYGEEMLTKSAFDAILDALIPISERSLNYESLDGTQENINGVISRINTYSLLPGVKVVALRDARIFYSGQDKDRLLVNAKAAYNEDNIKKAAGYLRNLMSLLNLSYEEIEQGNRPKSLGKSKAIGTDDTWLDEIIAYCREKSLPVLPNKDDGLALQMAIEKGFPKNNHLIITTDRVDKRRALFKTLNSMGVAIDCEVPKGDRRIERDAQQSVLRQKMKEVLNAGNKRMDQAAFMALYNMTGFDLRTFISNLEKLISYAGDRQDITVADIESVLRRTKKDPIYELTNALSERQAEPALFFLESILSSGIHPLQVFAALVNLFRRLLLSKDFIESSYGRLWQAACSYDYFQKQVIPAIIDYDRNLLDQISHWQDGLEKRANSQITRTAAKSKKKPTQIATDLLIAKNPKNAYPIYQLLKKSERYSKDELLDAYEILNAADKKLKISGQNSRLVLEKIILDICKVQDSEEQAQGARLKAEG